MLGSGTLNLFENTNQAFAGHQTLSSLMHLNGSQNAPIPSPCSRYTVITNANGNTRLELVDQSNGGATNVSSIEGSQMNTLGRCALPKLLISSPKSKPMPT